MTAALNHFISRSADRCRPFFQLFNKWKGFEWTEECAVTFQQLKEYLSRPPIMSRPKIDEVLFAYIAVADHVVSLVLIRVDDNIQKPIYHVKKSLHEAEGQVLANLVAEFAEPSIEENIKRLGMNEKSVGMVVCKKPLVWKVYVDGAANQRGSGVGLVVVTPEGLTLEKSLRLGFSATNNKAEYEALVVGMDMV
ncbi:uncharacterized protein LOC142631725 [Castanea sativa]|uniref:uncharacterized protein LOC142631725 n=1 Tax=Castanea sativa TaxID=21020 RepID=UPI003F652EA0